MTAPLTKEGAGEINAHYFGYMPEGHDPKIDAIRAHARGELVSIAVTDLEALQAKADRLDTLGRDRAAALEACIEGIVALHSDDALELGGITRPALELLRTDASLGMVVCKFIARMRAAALGVAPAEQLLTQLAEVIEPVITAERAKGWTDV
jgi:hypothetical protein